MENKDRELVLLQQQLRQKVIVQSHQKLTVNPLVPTPTSSLLYTQCIIELCKLDDAHQQLRQNMWVLGNIVFIISGSRASNN